MKPKSEYTLKVSSRQLVSVGLCLACLAAPARSQESTVSDTHELDPFVVVANRFELPLDRVGSSVEIIDSFDLQADKSTFLLDTVRSVPGFNLRNNGGPGGAFGITTRGLNSNRPTVLIDGIEVSNPASGSIINFGNLFTSNLSRVEILKGAQSSLYGADAIAGVISIETYNPGAADGGTLDLGGGSFGTYQGSLDYRGSAESFSYSVNLSHFESDGFSTQDPAFGAAWADDDAYENTTASASLAYHFGESSQLDFVAYYNDNYSEFDPGDPSFVFGTPFDGSYTEGDQLFAKLGFKSAINEYWETRVDLARSEVESQSKFSAGAPSLSLGRRYQLDWQNTVQASKTWSLVAGLEYETEEDRPADLSRDDGSIYLENVFALSDSLDWTLGGRYDDNEDYGSETTYRTTFSYRFADDATRLRGSYGTSFQAPTFFQLSETNGFGNPALGAESGEGWDIGVERSFAEGKVNGSVTYFGYDIDDKIVWDSSLTSPTRPWGTYANRERYRSEGLETAIAWQANDALRLKLAHTYASAEYEDGVEAERVPRHTASVSANWSALSNALNLNATVQHTSSQFSRRGDTEKQPSYTVVDLAANYLIDETYSVWIRVDNLLDEDYEEILLYQTPGLSGYAGVRMKF